MRLTGALGGMAAVLALAGCNAATVLPAGNLTGPVGLATAPTANEGDGTYVFVANADGEEVRVYSPPRGLFIRGPNAISPLSLPLGFRPRRLAGASVAGPAGPLGYVLVAGAGTRVAVVDAQRLEITTAPGAATDCATVAVDASLGCLRAPAVDVAALGAVGVASVTRQGATPGALVQTAATVEGGVVVARLTGAPVELEGDPGGVDLSSDGTVAWVADRTAVDVAGTGRVHEITLASGAIRALAADGPVLDVFAVPAYVDAGGVAQPADRFLLALLADGRLQTLDVVAGGPAASPLAAGGPIAPLSLGTPIRDVAFVPCPATAAGPCRTQLRLSTTEVRDEPLLAFAALADGNSLPLVPDPANPQVFRPIDTEPAGPAVSPVLARDVAGGTLTSPTLAVVPGSLTEGVTLSETITVTYRGALPALLGRAATLEPGAPVLTLAEAPELPAQVQAGDTVLVQAPAGCPTLQNPQEFQVDTVTATSLTLAAAPAIDASCARPVTVVIREGRAGAVQPWVVTSGARGFLARTSTDTTLEVPADRFFHPPGAAAGPAVAFTLAGADPAPGASFTFTTASGFVPFTICQLERLGAGVTCRNAANGVANAVAALPGRLFVGVLSGSILLDVELAAIGQGAGIKVLR